MRFASGQRSPWPDPRGWKKRTIGRQMKQKTGLFAAGLAIAANLAAAHTGATGVVLERMQSMTALRDIMRDIAPMFQGAAPYDALAISEAGYVIAAHSGDSMRALFPDGSLSGVTYAKSNIWEDWQEFSALADELRVYGKALSNSASTGQTRVAPPPVSVVPASPDTQADRTQQIATLMGYQGRVWSAPASGAALDIAGGTAPVPAGIGAEEAFARISGACSACHAKFRTGRS